MIEYILPTYSQLKLLDSLEHIGPTPETYAEAKALISKLQRERALQAARRRDRKPGKPSGPKKKPKARSGAPRAWESEPASDKQIKYLRALGYTGPQSITKGEAGTLISGFLGKPQKDKGTGTGYEPSTKQIEPRTVCRTFIRTKPDMTEAEIEEAAANYKPSDEIPF